MKYPLKIQFKLFAFAPQIFIKDVEGNILSYVRQKLFKLREKVEVYLQPDRQDLLCTIQADRIIDFSATYQIRDPEGEVMGSLKRLGMKSLWRTQYQICDESAQEIYQIREINPFAKVMDSFLGNIPVIGLLSTLVFQPRYGIYDGETQVFEISKNRSFFQRFFTIEKKSDDTISSSHEYLILMSLNMFVLLERQKG